MLYLVLGHTIFGCVVVSSHSLCLRAVMIAMFYIQRVIITSQLYCKGEKMKYTGASLLFKPSEI